jgi:hypothetical protein
VTARRRQSPAPPAIACLAFTAARGWHLATVDVEQLVAVELEDRFGDVPAEQACPPSAAPTAAQAGPRPRPARARRSTAPPPAASLLAEGASAAERWSRPSGPPRLRPVRTDVA